jgi:predicted DNA-binding protein
MSKSITLRLPKDEYDAFGAICEERGYSKTGKIREFIRSLVNDELERVMISKESWNKVVSAMGEIKRGEYVSFEELKRGYAAKIVDGGKSCKQRQKVSGKDQP